jgi:uroporphyrin-3 C-methyltransferase
MSEENTNEPKQEPTGDESVAPARASGDGRFAGLPGGIVPKLAIVVAVLASLIAGALWWQYRAFYVELSGQDRQLEANLEDTRALLRRLADEIDAVETALGQGDQRVTALADDLDALPAEIRAVERRVAALQGGQLEARESWLREQAEYYLVLANTELALGRRIGSAIEALELADDILRELGDPSLGGVRSAINAELQALRGIEQPDLERIVFDLGNLQGRVPDLPMRAQAPDNFAAAAEELDEVEPGIGRLWATTRVAVTSIVRVERQAEPVGQLLTESERRILRRQLALELQLARAAALDWREADFRASLVAADGILGRDFNREAQSIVAARELLAPMMQIELAPRLPDISDSLSLLRNAPGAP